MKLPYQHAIELVAEVHELLKPHCQRIEVAGSLRRRRPEVKDAELVVIPCFSATGTNLLWQCVEAHTYDPLNMFSDPDAIFAKAVYGATETQRWGPRYRGVMYKGLKVEIFSAGFDNWGCQFAIRTGPGENAPEIFRRMGLRGYRQAEGYLWKGEQRVDCPDEDTFFGAAGLPTLAPESRTEGCFERL